MYRIVGTDLQITKVITGGGQPDIQVFIYLMDEKAPENGGFLPERAG